jgi:hypothetical protein
MSENSWYTIKAIRNAQRRNSVTTGNYITFQYHPFETKPGSAPRSTREEPLWHHRQHDSTLRIKRNECQIGQRAKVGDWLALGAAGFRKPKAPTGETNSRGRQAASWQFQVQIFANSPVGGIHLSTRVHVCSINNMRERETLSATMNSLSLAGTHIHSLCVLAAALCYSNARAYINIQGVFQAGCNHYFIALARTQQERERVYLRVLYRRKRNSVGVGFINNFWELAALGHKTAHSPCAYHAAAIKRNFSLEKPAGWCPADKTARQAK